MFVWIYKVRYKTILQAVFLLVSYNMCFPMWNFQKAAELSSQLHHVQRLTLCLGLYKSNLFSSLTSI